ncbi:hypothetical protein, partial [Escherichia coli]|uniref:hypothetical protein n=1 Tax=Escherichia coli TaxID=562 RepID=UPI0020B3CBFD
VMATRVKNVGNWRIMPDATLAASYQAYKRCQNRRPDKASTPHPAISAPMPDATLAASYQACKMCQNRVGRIRRSRRIRQ